MNVIEIIKAISIWLCLVPIASLLGLALGTALIARFFMWLLDAGWDEE